MLRPPVHCGSATFSVRNESQFALAKFNTSLICHWALILLIGSNSHSTPDKFNKYCQTLYSVINLGITLYTGVYVTQKLGYTSCTAREHIL